MANETNIKIKEKVRVMNNGWGGIYGMAFLGALVYFLQHSTTFWDGVIGIAKAIFWPGVLVYKLLEYLKL